LKSLKIGNIEIKNVRTSISDNIESPLLLGQSALKKLPSYRIDNKNCIMIIE
jgi:predicted aspartyl protease